MFDGSAWAPSSTPTGLPRSKPSRSVRVLNDSFWGFHWSGRGGRRRGGLPFPRDRKTCQYFNHWTEKQVRRKLSFQNTIFFFNPHHELPHLLPAVSQGIFALGLCLLLPDALLKAAVTTSCSPQHWLTLPLHRTWASYVPSVNSCLWVLIQKTSVHVAYCI